MRRTMAVVALALTLTMVAGAEQVQMVLRDGEMGYSGVGDFMMYRPESVANVNYGDTDNMSTGINRWGEHYACIVRFNLSHVPGDLQVQSATLALNAREGNYPYRDIVVTARALTQANAGWVEGDGDGTRVPTPGAPCWNWLAYDTRAWAGEPGASEAGVDYSTDWAAEASVPKEGGAEATFELPAEIVQGWIDHPTTNAGIRLYPEMAEENGDIVPFHTSETQDIDLRPTLRLTLAGTPEAIARLRRSHARTVLANADAALAAARERYEQWGPPAAVETRLQQLEDNLREARARLAQVDDPVAMARDVLEAQTRAIDVLGRRMPLERGREWAAQMGGPPEFATAIEWPTVKVFPKGELFTAEFADDAIVRLARNEHEATQVVVVPLQSDLEGVSWEVRGFDAPGVEVSVTPVGFVETYRPQFADTSPHTDWWPDPLLSFMDEVDVRRGDVQPLWVDVHATEAARPGMHRGEVVIRTAAGAARTVALRVEVFDFTLPTEQHLKTIWGMSEGNFGRYYGDRYDDEFAWQYADMFLEHRMAVSDLYRSLPTGVKGEDGMYHFANVEALRRLKERGSGWWNIGYVLAPEHALNRDPWKGMTYDEYLQDYVGLLRDELQRVRAANWPEDRMGLYFLDETSDFEALAKAAQVMKDNFPEIPLMTTGYDRSYGTEETGVSKFLDIWVPLTPRYHQDVETIEQGRELGKSAWWYICVGPRDPGALNWFVEYPAIRARLLMGAAARKYATDGFLYYRVAGWFENDSPITSGPYTDWIPAYRGNLPDGDGQIICAGPDGPLATVRLENIRDGIEDYEYWWLLDELSDGDEAADVAEVPAALVTSVNEYSEDPELLADVRLRLARAIERLWQVSGGLEAK